jgi:glycosyltransferase involved in cell wall biosynthesis
MKNKLKLSACLTVYNHEKFLPVALDSVLNQSYPPDEFIIFDDGSTDSSPQILQEYARKFPVIKLTLYEENKGVEEMYSKLAEAATCEYVHFFASDDFLEPTFYEKSIEQLERYPKASFSSTLTRTVDSEGIDLGFIKTPIVSLKPAYFSPDEVKYKLKQCGIWQMSCATVYRRETFENIGLLNSDFYRLRSFLDTFIILLLALKNGCIFIPEVLSVLRKGEASFSAKMAKNEKNHADIVNFFKELTVTRFSDIFPKEFVRDFERSFWGLHLIYLSKLDSQTRLKKLNKVLDGKRMTYKILKKIINAGFCRGHFFLKLLVFSSYESRLSTTLYVKLRTRIFLKLLKFKGIFCPKANF